MATDMGERAGLLFDVSDPRRPRFLSRLPNSSGSGTYSFSADGALLAGNGSGTQLLAWDVWDPTVPYPVTQLTLDAEATELAVSSDGTTLTAYNYPGNVTLWNIAQLGATLRDPVGHACRLAAANPTAAEWAKIAPGVPFQRVCPDLAAAPSAPPPDAFPGFPLFSTPVPAGD